MIMKVLLIYPDTNFIELIERFFLTYSTWNWKTPIRIKTPKEIVNEKQKNQEEITVYSPTFSENSLTFKITKLNAKIIKNEFLNGFYEINELIQNNKQLNNFGEIIEGNKFISKYQNYIIIACVTNSQINQEKFCNFVENRIKSEIDEQICNIEEVFLKLFKKLDILIVSVHLQKYYKCTDYLHIYSGCMYIWG
uniref:polynucleotide adenylyltransferase n=1 Tax=Meloidogyne enterolobii TaxID=390850 RepID=A0A6V7U189_MELEN|nr:unnamed protein product [Meloidogyne enterolobii]